MHHIESTIASVELAIEQITNSHDELTLALTSLRDEESALEQEVKNAVMVVNKYAYEQAPSTDALSLDVARQLADNLTTYTSHIQKLVSVANVFQETLMQKQQRIAHHEQCIAQLDESKTTLTASLQNLVEARDSLSDVISTDGVASVDDTIDSEDPTLEIIDGEEDGLDQTVAMAHQE